MKAFHVFCSLAAAAFNKSEVFFAAAANRVTRCNGPTFKMGSAHFSFASLLK